MKKRYKIFMVLGTVFTIIFTTSQNANTFSSGSPLSNTGSPGDGTGNTCAKGGCHVGTVGSGSGSVTIDLSDIPSSGYAPGQTYSIGVTVAENNRFTYGFQLTVEDPNANKFGTLIAGTGSRIEFNDWVTHNMNSGTGQWTFSWTAPSSTQDAIFYAAGNAANGNGTASGDNIYVASVQISRDPIASVQERFDQIGVNVYNILGQKNLIIETEERRTFEIYSIAGSMVYEFTAEQGNSNVSLSVLPDGQYILVDRISRASKKIVLN